MLCCAVLCCAVLCCAVLCCAVLCCLAKLSENLNLPLLAYDTTAGASCDIALQARGTLHMFTRHMGFKHSCGVTPWNLYWCSFEHIYAKSESFSRDGRTRLHYCVVCAQVAYTAMIPCMLFTKCAATLAANRSLVLIALPLTAVLQVVLPLVLTSCPDLLPNILS